MAYTTVPNTFTSATTLFASAMTANLTAITDGLTSGVVDVGLYNIQATTFNVSSLVACSSIATCYGTAAIGTSGSGDSIDSTTSVLSKLSIGTPETCVPVLNTITPSKSNVIVEGSPVYKIETTNFLEGAIIILTCGTVPVSIANGSNMKLGALRTLTNASDRLVLQLVDTFWYELQFQSNG